ncbi:MAG: RloB domain-containing protein [Nitrospirae bacterium]|nr:RloB domain-containing protein [Nitrospirota bacterium]
MAPDKLHQKRKAHAAKELKRREATRSTYKRALVVCEDGKSSATYFKEIRASQRIQTLNMKVIGAGCDPKRLVETAVEEFRKHPDYDYVLCVFDRDSHNHYQNAVASIQQTPLTMKCGRKSAGQADFRAITSEPCFEFWLLLHFTDHTAPIAPSGGRSIGEQTEHLLKQHWPAYHKGSAGIFQHLENRRAAAGQLAAAGLLRASANGTSNPHTHVHEAVDILFSLRGTQ